MRRRKRSLKLLLIGKFALIGFLYLLFFTKPMQEFSLLFFLLLLFISTAALTAYATYDVRKGLIAGSGITGYLILRFLHLTEPFFIIVLIALLVSLNFVFSPRRS